MSAAPRRSDGVQLGQHNVTYEAVRSGACARAAGMRRSRTPLRSVSNAPFWNSIPKRLPHLGTSCALVERRDVDAIDENARPRSGISWRVISRNRVVLPVPLGPMIAVTSPRLIVDIQDP